MLITSLLRNSEFAKLTSDLDEVECVCPGDLLHLALAVLALDPVQLVRNLNQLGPVDEFMQTMSSKSLKSYIPVQKNRTVPCPPSSCVRIFLTICSPQTYK